MNNDIPMEENPLTINSKIEYLNGLAVKNNEPKFLISEKEEKQILDDHEQAEKYNKIINILNDKKVHPLGIIKYFKTLEQENKQLKEDNEKLYQNATKRADKLEIRLQKVRQDTHEILEQDAILKQKLELSEKVRKKITFMYNSAEKEILDSEGFGK